MSSWQYRMGLCLAAACFLGCAAQSGRRLGGQPSWRKPTKVAGSRSVSSSLVLEATAQASEVFNGREPEVEETELASAIYAAVREVAERMGKDIPRPDGRLVLAATELAGVAPEDQPLPYRLVEFALQRNGIVEPSPHMIVIWGPDDGPPRDILEKLYPRLPEILGEADFKRVAVGTVRRGNDEAVTVLAFQESYVRTKPIPRSLPSGGDILIDGSVQAPYSDPRVYVTRPGATDVVRMSLAKHSGRGFQATVPCADSRGAMQIEITAVDASGSTVLANFPVWCNTKPPRRIEVDFAKDEGRPIVSIEDAETRLFELVNRDRADNDLPALVFDKELAVVARAHSLDMKSSKSVAHISSTTGSASDRVRRAKVVTSVVLENVARAYGVHEAEAGLMNSPGHRANIVSREATHVGIGVVFGEEIAGRRELFITQLFGRRPERLTVHQAERKLAQAVAKLGPLPEDQGLSRVAQNFAKALARGEPADVLRPRATAELKRHGASFLTVTTLTTALADVDAFDPGDSLKDPDVTHFGIGVGKGPHSVMGEDAYHVVILLGEK